MSSAARVVAQAKVNLFLRILEREPSGFHQLQTLFCRLTLGDVVTVRVGGRGRSLDCAGPTMPEGGLGPVEENLAWRAAAAFAGRAGWPDGFAIEIDKRIPVGGGLGGGSADAGAVLRILQHLAPAPLPPSDLHAIAAGLGADVAFLAGDAALALAEGRGERMTALPPLPPRPVSLVAFREGVHTGRAYGWLADSRRGRPAPPRVTDPLAPPTGWPAIAALAVNDFEEVVLPRRPDIAAVLATLRAPALREAYGPDGFALMSGSGATCLLVRSEEAGLRAVGSPLPGTTTLETRTADRVVPVEPIA